jgi:hypothetical protein
VPLEWRLICHTENQRFATRRLPTEDVWITINIWEPSRLPGFQTLKRWAVKCEPLNHRRVPHPFAHFAKEPALSAVEGAGFHNSRPLSAEC